MKILVAGGGGFVGCNLIPQLIEEGHDVKCLDKFYFGEDPIESFRERITVIKDDIRTFNPSILEDIDIVINLAAISQPDQQRIINPKLYNDINHLGCVRLARLSKKRGVKRYIVTSTCSIYGFQKDVINEQHSPNPLEPYGKSKLLMEKNTLPLADEDFIITILRPGTMYGFSHKMRFDLVINGMTWALYQHGKIDVMRDGTQWRPNVHVNDVTRLIIKLMDFNKEKIQKEVFNVGENEQNYQILPLARLIGNSISENYEISWYGSPDIRSYRIDFTKLKERIGFKIKNTVSETVRNIYEALSEGRTEKSDKTSVIKWYKILSERGIV